MAFPIVAKVLFDTTSYIDLQRSRKHPSEIWAINITRHTAAYVSQVGRPCLSTLTVIEITKGFEQEANRQKLQIFREQIAPRFEILGFDFDTACLAGEILRET